jgi:hypothetical protein
VPTRKVTAAAIAGAVTIIIMTVLTSLGVYLDPSVVSAITTLLSFAASYLTGEDNDGAHDNV